jgi:hypothetical protein
MSLARFLSLPSLSAAFLGLVLSASGQTPGGSGNLLDQAKQRDQVAIQKAEADVRLAFREANRLATSDPAQSVEKLKALLAQLERDSVLSVERRAALVRVVKDRINSAETEGDARATAAAALDEKQAQAAIRRTTEERQGREAEQTRQRLSEVTELRKQGRTDEAMKRAADLAKEQPNNPSARAANQTATTHEQVLEARKIRVEGERRRVVAMREVERSALPVIGEIEFPKDWQERTKHRKTGVQLTAKERALVNSLNTPITVNFRGTRLEDVLEYLRTFTGQTILEDKAGLDEVQVNYDTPVTANVKGVALRTLLRKVLSELNLTYVVKDETIQITSLTRARELMVVRSYYIADIVAGVGWQHPAQLVQNINNIIDMVQNSVDPQSWRANGGPGTITFNPGTMSLVVKQSAEVHALLAGGLLK